MVEAAKSFRVETSAMKMEGFVLNFSGKFDKNMVMNSMAYMVPKDKDVVITVKCEIVG